MDDFAGSKKPTWSAGGYDAMTAHEHWTVSVWSFHRSSLPLLNCWHERFWKSQRLRGFPENSCQMKGRCIFTVWPERPRKHAPAFVNRYGDRLQTHQGDTDKDCELTNQLANRQFGPWFTPVADKLFRWWFSLVGRRLANGPIYTRKAFPLLPNIDSTLIW